MACSAYMFTCKCLRLGQIELLKSEKNAMHTSSSMGTNSSRTRTS
ncbi:hypothetical protein T08_14165 [Trichinella sp. T8]|nr:hypothetical protein T08_14165 [Trichinella sp. T8]